MRIGTIKVREALGSGITVSDAQIQEALWHYYYDVGKSVTYLKSMPFQARRCFTEGADLNLDKFAPSKPTPAAETKKPKAVSKFDQAASAAGIETKTAPGTHIRFHFMLRKMPCTVSRLEAATSPSHVVADRKPTRSSASKGCADTMYTGFPFSASVTDSISSNNFFWDTPWCNVPSHRLGNLLAVPVHPPGRLLGGSSKLKALAAARKKKQQQQEEAQGGAASATTAPERNPETDKAVALLDRLSVKGKDSSPSTSANGNTERKTVSKYLSRKRAISPGREAPKTEEPPTPEETSPSIEIPNLRTGPSLFASTLCGPRGQPSKKPRLEPDVFPLHDSDSKASMEANPFAGPSPDDIVLRAQAKGAVHG